MTYNNDNTTYWNIWNTIKETSTEKLITLNTSLTAIKTEQ